MDTRFWGPDGWKLLHCIAQNYPENPSNTEKDTYSIFFESIKYVLPCIYCRISYTQYIDELPIVKYLNNKKGLTKWIYLIHNKVNDKLRKQGLLHYEDPSYDSVYKLYKNYLIEVNNNIEKIPGWDFIYSIIFNYPLSYTQIETIRMYNYIIFFRYLGFVIPFKQVRELYNDYMNKNPIYKHLESRIEIKKWSYDLEKYISSCIDKPCISYIERCKRIEGHRAGCKRKTCRYLGKK
jgi:hypothetical protein